MTAWLMYSIVTGGFIALAALGAEGLLKSTRRPVRAVWCAAIALTIGFTLTAPLRTTPPLRVEALSMSMQLMPSAEFREPTFAESSRARGDQVLQLAMLPLQVATNFAPAVPASVNNSLRWLSIASAVIALLALVAVYARSMRERMKWPSLLLLGRTVRVTPNVGPAVLGLAPPEIVVPQWVLLRNTEEQRLVLEHESEHVRANDPLLLMFACVAVACMPWNPAVWFLWSRLRLAVELDCDRRVLRRGVQKSTYGQLLVELSSSRPWMSPAIPAFSWGTSHLEQRLVAMTARPTRFRFLRRLASGVVVATALLAAARAEMPAPEQLQAMEASHLTQGVDGATKYFVEGNGVKKDSASVVISVAQDTIPRKKVRKVPVVVPKKTPIKKTVARDTSAPLSRNRYLPDSGQRTDTLIRRNYEPNSWQLRDTTSRLILSADTVVIVMSDTGRAVEAPGSRIRIRGQSSLTLYNQPLIIVDGVVFRGSLDSFDPKSIESIEVIKGAAAGALYGPIAANGVISIKTKR